MKVQLGVGLHSGYGSAQRIYIKRGYIPDGSGVWYNNEPLAQYADCKNDDELVLFMTERTAEGKIDGLYHGSIIPHLTELHPFEGKENNLKKPCVYLTTNPQLAIHYIRDKSRLWISPTLDVREDGVLVYQEMFSNALEYMYKGVSGYIYRVSGDYGINTVPGVRFAAVSDEPVPIIDSKFIPDVYDAIYSFADDGKFIYDHYEICRSGGMTIFDWVLK